MELRHLISFVAVAEELHFGRAAKRLRMAQPPLSQQIRQLEKELGVQLFERSTRSVRLTSAGQSFLKPVRTVLDDLDIAVRVAKAAGEGEYGRVTVGFAGASSHATLPLLTRAVRAAHPGIELVMKGQTYATVALDRVADGSLDLGFVRLPVNRPGIASRFIGEEELLCALPSDHPLAERERIAVADLAAEPFVTFPANAGSTLRDATLRVCEEAGFRPRTVQEAPDSYTILALVAAGVGVTLTLSSCLHIQQTGLVHRPLDGPPVRLRSALAWRRDNPSAALRSVLAVAEEALPTPPTPPGPPGPDGGGAAPDGAHHPTPVYGRPGRPGAPRD
ncbi:LysR family transcriptional regulator [Streptomyces sp. MNU89]|uniref:LysR family transcriptional regulator n=1 Tax=Streptomyces sp. MNU89 TaxID=2560025 RepID=UPI001E3AB34C|nr:LysR family transcriptional regulator [Streptomyces sp. MNU89]MCC9742776.1 LysR family transcriptional regulator [Streptomyces sp. MNU89]